MLWNVSYGAQNQAPDVPKLSKIQKNRSERAQKRGAITLSMDRQHCIHNLHQKDLFIITKDSLFLWKTFSGVHCTVIHCIIFLIENNCKRYMQHFVRQTIACIKDFKLQGFKNITIKNNVIIMHAPSTLSFNYKCGLKRVEL